MLRGGGWAAPLYLVASGMLIYSVIVSLGYFAQRGQWVLVAIFLVLLGLGGLACIQVATPLIRGGKV